MHPLPDDVTRSPTVDIVKSIRCEALTGLDSLTPAEKSRAAPIVKASVIGFDFTFTIDEDDGVKGANGASPANSFLRLKDGDKTTADLTGSATLKRTNKRRFKVVEPLADLASAENRKLCATRTTGANWTYPIGGKIGLDEVVQTYLKLEILSELQADSKTGSKNGVFADDLIFTTMFTAGATGKLVLDAVVGQLKVSNGAINVGASRKDVHRVIVALTRATVDVDESAFDRRSFMAAADRRNRRDLLLADNIRDPRTQAILIQIDQDAATRVAFELYRRHSLNDADNAPAQALGQRLLDVLKLP